MILIVNLTAGGKTIHVDPRDVVVNSADEITSAKNSGGTAITVTGATVSSVEYGFYNSYPVVTNSGTLNPRIFVKIV